MTDQRIVRSVDAEERVLLAQLRQLRRKSGKVLSVIVAGGSAVASAATREQQCSMTGGGAIIFSGDLM